MVSTRGERVGSQSQLAAHGKDVVITINDVQEKLLKTGCNPTALQQLMRLNLIKDYKRLYYSVLHIPLKDRKKIDLWELLLMSGELKAIEHGVSLVKNKKNLYGNGLLHWAAWSGSVIAMNYLIDVRGADPGLLNAQGMNVLHCAARGGSVATLHYAVSVLRIPTLSMAFNGANVLHFAAEGGSVETVMYVLNQLGINISSVCDAGATIMHYAASGASLKVLRYLRQLDLVMRLGISAYDEDENGYNVYHYAKLSSNVEGVIKVLHEKVDPLPPVELMDDDDLSLASFKISRPAIRVSQIPQAFYFPSAFAEYEQAEKKEQKEQKEQKEAKTALQPNKTGCVIM